MRVESRRDRRAVQAVRELPAGEGARTRWSALTHLSLGQAVALPITEEAGGELKMFNIGQRLTPHVRHRQKYVDVPVTESRAFQFAGNGLRHTACARFASSSTRSTRVGAGARSLPAPGRLFALDSRRVR